MFVVKICSGFRHGPYEKLPGAPIQRGDCIALGGTCTAMGSYYYLHHSVLKAVNWRPLHLRALSRQQLTPTLGTTRR